MERLIILRKNADKTQKEIADVLGISRQAYANYEIDNREPDNETLMHIADYYGVTVDYLLGHDVSLQQKKPDTMTGAELDEELVKLLCSVPPDQVQRVKDFVAGMIAAREKPLSKESDEAVGQADTSPHPTKD